MKRKLNYSKVIPVVLDYIRESFIASGAKKIVLRVDFSLQDLTLVALCSEAVGPEHLDVVFHECLGIPSCNYKKWMGIDDYFILDKLIGGEQKIEDTKGRIDIASTFASGLRNLSSKISRQNYRYLRGMIPMIYHSVIRQCTTPQYLRSGDYIYAMSSNFANVITMKKCFPYKFSVIAGDTIFPLYWFTPEEIFAFGFILGLFDQPINYTVLESIMPSSRDNEIDKWLKMTLLPRIYIEQLDVFNDIVNNIPRVISVPSPDFFAGQCYCCYDVVEEA